MGGRQSSLIKETIPVRIFRKATSQLYGTCAWAGGGERKAGQQYMYVLTAEQRSERLEKGRKADDLVFPLNSGKYVINDSMYVLCGKSAYFAFKIHLVC